MASILWIVGGIVVGAVVVDRVAVALERRGLVYWRKTNARGAGGIALLAMQETIEPHAAALIETERDDEERQDDDDAADGTGRRQRR